MTPKSLSARRSETLSFAAWGSPPEGKMSVGELFADKEAARLPHRFYSTGLIQTIELRRAAEKAYAEPTGTESEGEQKQYQKGKLPKGQEFVYGDDDDPLEESSSADDYRSYFRGKLLDRSTNGTKQFVSDVQVTAGPGATTVMATLTLVVQSGFLSVLQESGGRNGLVGPSNRFGGPSTMSSNLVCVSKTTVWLAEMLDPAAEVPNWIRAPFTWAVDSVPPTLESNLARREETSRMFILLGCCFFTLLAWFDSWDHEYTASTRQSECRQDGVATDIDAPVDRMNCFGTPAFARLTVTGAMRKIREDYNLSADASSGNHKSVLIDVDKIKETLASDLARRYSLCMDPLVKNLVPTCLTLPLGLNIKRDGKRRLITDAKFTGDKAPEFERDGSTLPASLNEAVPKDSVVRPIYGNVVPGLCSEIWNMRIAHPHEAIYATLVDQDSAFRHMKHNWRIIPAVAFIFFGFIFFNVAASFGTSFAPGEYSYMETKVQLQMESLSMDMISCNSAALSYSEAHLWLVPAAVATAVPVVLARAYPDALNPGYAITPSSMFRSVRVFVDDFVLLSIAGTWKGYDYRHLMFAGLLWSKICVFSPIDLPFRNSFISRAKLKRWFRKGVILGYFFDLDNMTISCPVERLDEIAVLVREWRQGAKRLTVKDIASLMGNFRFIAGQLPGGVFLSIRLNLALQEALRGLSSTSRFSPQWRSSVAYEVPLHLQQELDYVEFYLSDTASRSLFLCSPIELRVWRTPELICPSDASGFGAGGWVAGQGFGWRQEWPTEVKTWFEENRSINALEFVGVILNFCLVSALVSDRGRRVPCLFFTDNSASKAWAGLACLPAPTLSALSRVFGVIMAMSNVMSKTAHVPGEKNETADSLSRELPEGATNWLRGWLNNEAEVPTTDDTNPLSPPHRSPQDRVTTLIPIPPLLLSILCSAMLSNTSPPPEQLIATIRTIKFDFSAIGLGQKLMLQSQTSSPGSESTQTSEAER